MPKRVARAISIALAFEELEKVGVSVKEPCHLLGEHVVVHPLAQLQGEARVIGNVFITKVNLNLEYDRHWGSFETAVKPCKIDP